MSASVPDCIGAVLAGGRGRRLGGAKATVALAERPLISYPLAAMAAAGLDPVVVAKTDSGLPIPAVTVPVIEEPAEPRHPLRGIVSALEHAEGSGAEAVVVLACDMPLVTAQFLAWLAGLEHPLAMPLLDGRPQPLAARYGVALLPALRRALRERPGPLTELVLSQDPYLLAEPELSSFGDPRRLLHNVNTAADLELAAGWLPG